MYMYVLIYMDVCCMHSARTGYIYECVCTGYIYECIPHAHAHACIHARIHSYLGRLGSALSSERPPVLVLLRCFSSHLRSPLHVCTVRVCFLRFSDIALAARLYSPWTPARRIPGSGLWAAASTKRFVSAGFCGNIYCAVNLPLPWNANHFGAYFNFGGERDVPLGGPHIIDAVKPCLR